MNHPLHQEDAEDFTGNVNMEAHKEMIQIFGAEKPDHAWILTDFDVWEKNPYYNGPEVPHPEDDYQPMNKNLLHFGKAYRLTIEQVKKLNLSTDSGNGYYSYSYYVLPYSGVINKDNQAKVSKILFDRHYRPPFASFNQWTHFSEHEILVAVTYHHGD